MKIGDLVKYKNRYRETIGIVVDIMDVTKHNLAHMPYICREAIVSWTSDGDTWVSTEDAIELEVVNESR